MNDFPGLLLRDLRRGRLRLKIVSEFPIRRNGLAIFCPNEKFRILYFDFVKELLVAKMGYAELVGFLRPSRPFRYRVANEIAPRGP